MSLDLTRTHFDQRLEFAIETGEEITQLGMCLISRMESGGVVTKVSAADSGEVFLGFAFALNESNAIKPIVEEALTVPAASPYTVQLAHTALVHTSHTDSSVRINRTLDADGVAADAEFSLGATASATTVANAVAATGVLTFHADDTGITFNAHYRYNLTVAEAEQTYYQRHIGNQGANAFLGQLTVGLGPGLVYTDQFDTQADFGAITTTAAAPVAVTTGAAGLLTVAGNGSKVGSVIHIPTAADPYLGVHIVAPNMSAA